ncbi:MAG: thioredoxin-disulfide reductase [Propionibacteriaceae bacterium]
MRDIIIVGSGPAGYTAAIYAARAGFTPLVFEGAFTAGGALMTTTEVENFPGFPDGIMGPDLMANMRSQAEKFGAELIADDIQELDLTGEVKKVTDSEGTVHEAKAVILATGSAYRHLGVPGEEEFSAKGVSWCATCDGFFFRDKEIAVIGGGDSAAEEADFLTRFASKVTLVHRRGELRASQVMAQRVQNNPKIDFAWNSEVVEFTGGKGLEAIVLKDTQTAQTRELPVAGAFIAIGHDPRSELVRGQIALDESGFIQVQQRTQKTNVAGVFACGDVVDHTYQQAITAAGSGCAAALDAQAYLNSLAD